MTDGTDFAEFEAAQNAAEAAPEEAPKPESAPADPDAPPVDPDAAPAPDDDPAPADVPPAKPKPTVQDRIDEITRARREAERDAEYWKGVAEGRIKPNQQNGHDRQPEAPKAAEAPNPDDYEFGATDERYLKAVIDHGISEGIKKGLDKVEERVAQDLHIQAEERAWEAKQDSARSKFDDYDDKVVNGADNWPCSREMAQAIRTSDVGGELAYHLASNPDEARRITALDPFSQIRELGRLEARLDAPATTDSPPVTTKAPKPAEVQARGAGGKFAPNAATENFEEFEAMANRKT